MCLFCENGIYGRGSFIKKPTSKQVFFLYVTKIEFLSSTSSGTSIGLEALLIL